MPRKARNPISWNSPVSSSRTNSDSPLPSVTGDRVRLMSVFQNLIANAIKFRRPDLPPEVTVSAVRERKMWHVVVADNGIGIEPEYFDRIFVIFQRLHARDHAIVRQPVTWARRSGKCRHMATQPSPSCSMTIVGRPGA